MELSKAHTTSNNQNWETPVEFFYYLQRLLKVDFSLDLASSRRNALCSDHYSEVNNAFLNLPWVSSGAIFCNPPYSDKSYPVKEWVYEALDQQESFPQDFVFLLPLNKCDQQWFHDVLPYAKIGFVNSRIQFTIDGFKGKNSNSQGSVVICIGPSFEPGIFSIDWRNNRYP